MYVISQKHWRKMHIYRGYDTNDDTDAEAHMN